MKRSTIVIASKDTTLATDSVHFTLRSHGRKIGRIPLAMIGQMVIHAEVKITDKAFDRLATLGIPVTFLNRCGRVRARLVAPWKHTAAPRIEQARVFLDPALRLAAARRWVDAKLANSATLLQQHAANYPNKILTDAAARLRKLREETATSESIPSLMGVEGSGARVYFTAFNEMLRTKWAEFPGRSRRPPLDPVNSLISYTYAILRNELLALVEGAGLDAYIGCLHQPESRRPSLVLDLMEPFRPMLADRLVLRLLNLGILKEQNFKSAAPQPGVLITAEGRRAILEAVVPWVESCDTELGAGMPSPRGLLVREVDRYAEAANQESLSDFIPHYFNPKDAYKCPGLEACST